MPSDQELLRQFAENRDERAFAELVRRHASLVYSVALRVARNDPIAQDVTQRVFTKLVSHAGVLSRYDTMIGWLHTTARHAAIDAVRGEERRRAHEQESAAMQSNSTTPSVNWDQIAPLLDEAVDSLRDGDRKAVLLRFFQGLSHQEVGAALGLSEDTVRKRVERALEKLRRHFARRGVTAAAALLAEAISENSVQAAPGGLAESVVRTSLAGNGVGPGLGVGGNIASGNILSRIFLMNPKTTLFIAAAIVLMVTTTWVFYPHSSPKTATVATIKGEVVAPASFVAAPKVVTAAIVPPAPKADAILSAATQHVTVPASASDADLQTDLKTALKELARLARAGDDMTTLEKFTPPDAIEAQQRVKILKQQMDDSNQQLEALQPGILQKIAALRQANPLLLWEHDANRYEEIEDQTPTFNATGDEATYITPPQQAYQLRGGMTMGPVAQGSITFIKINGKWYLKYLGEVSNSSAVPAPPPPPAPGLAPAPGLPSGRGLKSN